MAKSNQRREDLSLRYLRFEPEVDNIDRLCDHRSCDFGVIHFFFEWIFFKLLLSFQLVHTIALLFILNFCLISVQLMFVFVIINTKNLNQLS